MADRVDRPRDVVEEKDPHGSAPDKAGNEAVPTTDQQPADQRGDGERDEDKRQKELRDRAKPRILDEILRVARAVGTADGREQPACVGVPESLRGLEWSISELRMRA